MLIFAGAVSARARIIHVPNDSPTIQGAIDSAIDGDSVLVHPGTYVERLNFLGKSILVTGSAPEDSAVVARTIVDAAATKDDPASVVTLASGEGSNSILTGLTLTGGTGTVIRAGRFGAESVAGGGVLCTAASSPHLRHLVIHHNRVVGEPAMGGGLHCREHSSPRLTNCTIRANSTGGSYMGGGGGLYSNAATPILMSCRVIGNWTTGSGGGLRCHASSPTLTRCRVTGNTVTRPMGSGGGLHCSASAVELADCTISGNSSLDTGGALVCVGSTTATMIRCRLDGNRAGNASGTGGAIHGVGSSFELTDCTVADNDAAQHGGGIYCWQSSVYLLRCVLATNSAGHAGGGIYCYSSSPVLANCTIVGNTAFSGAGGLHGENDSTPSIINSILWRDAPTEIGGDSCSPRIAYSDVYGGWPGPGNIDADPRFCDVVCGSWDDLGLAADSPCLEAGYEGADMGATGPACDSPAQHMPRVLAVPSDYATIGDALKDACDRDTVLVAPGTYLETTLEVPPLDLVIRGWDPGDPERVRSTAIVTGGKDALVFPPSPSGRGPCATVAGLTISSNRSGIVCLAASPLIDRCTVLGPGSGKINHGSGIYCSWSSPTVERCTVAGIASTWAAAGIHCHHSSPTLVNCSIVGNTSLSRTGGALTAYYSSPTLHGCLVSDNSVIGDYSRGGGVYCHSSSPVLSNCTFTNNTSDDRGGGLYFDSSTPVLTNCIVWNNAPEGIEVASGSPIVTFSDVQQGWPGKGNIEADPGFRSAGSYDQLLGPGSPCIDTGDPTIEDALSDWHRRWPSRLPNGARSDMGAYGGPENGGWLGRP